MCSVYSGAATLLIHPTTYNVLHSMHTDAGWMRSCVWQADKPVSSFFTAHQHMKGHSVPEML